MEWSEIPEINLFSDGGAEPNPGKGGFGVVMEYKGKKKEFCVGYELTTNNRMELSGVIFGLERLKTKSIVNVYTDSRYVIDGIEKGWAKNWRAKNWYRKGGERAINFDLWGALLTLIEGQEKVTFNWVKGHAGHIENERCDQLANFALNGANLLVDTGYLDSLLEKENKGENTQGGSRKIKVNAEGDACRKCGSMVVKKATKDKKQKPGKSYYYEYILLCPGCKTMYLVEDAKRDFTPPGSMLFN
jgi:ribonuclease HI